MMTDTEDSTSAGEPVVRDTLTTPDVDAALSVPAVLTNRVVVWGTEFNMRIAFLEESQQTGAMVGRAAVVMNRNDAISLYQVLSLIMRDWGVSLAAQEKADG